MWLFGSVVWILYALFLLGEPKPQQDTEKVTLLDVAKVAIEKQESAITDIDYNKIGEPKVCGYSSKNVSHISKNAKEARKQRDWPWMAVIILKNLNTEHFCGGALISQRHILTASHCFHNAEYILKAKDIVVRLGEYDFSKNDDSQITDLEVKEIRNHEDWDLGTNENDISILYLAKTVHYSIYAQPICLPLPLEDFTGLTAFVIGWGSTNSNGSKSDVLLEVPVQVWKQDECVENYAETIYSTVICATGPDGGKDSCQGDSGGPLMTQREDGRWIIIGIVSWGKGCGDKEKPGIYTRVNRYLDWIAERIQDVN